MAINHLALMRVEVVNGSGETINDVEWVLTKDDEPVLKLYSVLTMTAGAQLAYDVVVPNDGKLAYSTIVRFNDAVGRRWERDTGKPLRPAKRGAWNLPSDLPAF